MLIMNQFQSIPFIISLFLAGAGVGAGDGGTWSLLQPSIGISAMHMQLLPNDRVLIFDRTDFGQSNISLPDGKCRDDPNDTVLKRDCTAHSVEYDVVSNSIRPLTVQTDVWCSSGAMFPDGSFVQTGGYSDGERNVRVFKPCSDCDWLEIPSGLINKRWYSTNHILPDGTKQIIIGGRRQFNYEFYPKTSPVSSPVYKLPFLAQTNDPKIENNLYPFVFLNVDGNLFIFANNRAILFDYQKSIVVKNYPQIPGGDPRSYPSTGSAVLLPLKNLNAQTVQAEVLVCGGAPKGSYVSAQKGEFVRALNTCGRIRINDPDPMWIVETMPYSRVMGDMLLLPNGHVLIINGAGTGTAGWEYGRDPVFSPVVYRPDRDLESRFDVQSPSNIPRMYHSSALLLRDGRVLVGGSNPHTYYNFTGVMFPTDLTLESFSPSYLNSDKLRPKIITPVSGALKFAYGQQVSLRFRVDLDGSTLDGSSILVTMVSPSFNTHSFAMNARLLVLDIGNSSIVSGIDSSTFDVTAAMPSSNNLAPAGFYLLFVVHREIPSEGIWVRIE
ncbi:aldehyde oxidase GLOX-like [Impatiens glandulifera]|uniref:aldehyde oxidase GLOX-like n=1 Tax=Impatiens glandulifera TaxID=253017 RepID=UPI001FB0BAC2|nr:aldehyde oxidase GLOX-like [Impatiens glandulifera]